MNRQHPQPLRILMSQPSMAQLGEAVAEVMGAQPYELMALDAAVASNRTDADVAFISREVTGASTKHEIHPALQQVYDLLSQSPGLQWVHIHSAGADRQIYLDLRARGVQIATSSGANAQVVATMALAGLLALARRFPMLWAEQQAQQWIPMLGERMPRDLPGQTATIVGWGPIGQKLSSLLQALGLNVVAVRQQAGPQTPLQADAVERVTFEQLQQVLPGHTFQATADHMILGQFGEAAPAIEAAFPGTTRDGVVDRPRVEGPAHLIGLGQLRVCPHENTAIHMAGGYAVATGRGQPLADRQRCEVFLPGLGPVRLGQVAHRGIRKGVQLANPPQPELEPPRPLAPRRSGSRPLRRFIRLFSQPCAPWWIRG